MSVGLIWILFGIMYINLALVQFIYLKTDVVDGFLSGERDYSKLKGDTRPLVYPAGFLYVYSLVKFVTGGHVFPPRSGHK
ncbi:Dol-P-Man:Man(5)GlcNAc(2)-PP-Dol [Carex littledalei]|uniref:dolichyl-P-Man:Man5GlcNAc2-PP-dolichol alpha-1,3-mannosyltransferase n=1 Tax=Carex littledalei TaxID=544730 RepID=A0A833W0Q5_9POAL|nr:Dol-P-Man:Man(5)GlcNAc(2)-PP-Dol [Carex littledalei]